MEKAKLIIELTKKKKLKAKLHFPESGKTMPLGNFKPKDDSQNGKTVDVEREKGQVVKVLLDSQVIFSIGKNGTDKENKSKRDEKSKSFAGGGKDIKHIKEVSYPASAPYNFVPLNKDVIEISPKSLPVFNNLKGEEKSKSNRYHEDRFTGWIELDIEAKTPLYIRGTLNSEEMKKQQKAESEGKKYINSDFYSPNGRKQIPGSSLKGMIRNIMEITTYGKFAFFDDKTLYYRGLADKSNLRSEYQQKVSSYDSRAKKSIYTVSAGVLTREGFNYFITPSNYEPGKLSNLEKDKYEPINFYKRDNGFLIVSGKMQNKKRDWIIHFPDKEATKIPIPEMDIQSYKGDTNRGNNVPNLIECLDNHNQKEVPCFYVQWQDSQGKDRVSFGHTIMFRLAYEKTIGDHVPVPRHRIDNETITRLKENNLSSDSVGKIKTLEKRKYNQKELEGKLKQLNFDKKQIESILGHTAIIDFVEAIFGNEKTFSGRVFFEDAFLNEGQGQVKMGKSIPEILSSPKPTTFQHYLTQTSDNSKELNHYNTEAPIRGYKLYWHKSGNNWQENNPPGVDSETNIVSKTCQHTIINPMLPETQFTGKIRFENFAMEELGAVLFALSLPEGCCHKLGMGKPLGLGSVTITPTLFLSNRRERYKNLFAEWGENNPEAVDFKDYISKFEKYILEQLKEPNIQSLWDTERLKELKIILDYEIGKELESKGKIMYMNITPENEFKNRSVLPLPSDLESLMSNNKVEDKE
jgi:CRISPR-associated protein (TIGR03986 family)